jgi:hypothetical protein
MCHLDSDSTGLGILNIVSKNFWICTFTNKMKNKKYWKTKPDVLFVLLYIRNQNLMFLGLKMAKIQG